jgi:hypothetical protein
VEEISDPFDYSDAMQKILFSKFHEFGAYNDFEMLLKGAITFYDHNDEISKFIKLININKKFEEIILKKLEKKGDFACERFKIEKEMIKLVDEEYDNNVQVTYNFN